MFMDHVARQTYIHFRLRKRLWNINRSDFCKVPNTSVGLRLQELGHAGVCDMERLHAAIN